MRDSEHLGKKIVTIFVSCLSRVIFSKERIFIECHREHLGSNCSNSYNKFYFSDSDDIDFSDNDQKINNKSILAFISFHRIQTLQF